MSQTIMSSNKSAATAMGSLRLDSMGPDSVFVEPHSENQSVTFGVNYCTIHPNNVVDLYCKTCNQPACSDCITGRHRNCNANLCSLHDAMEARRRIVAKHKETMLKELKKISETRHQMLTNTGIQQDVYSVIEQEVLKCEEDAILAIKNETRKILDSLKRVCSDDQQSLESKLFYVATIVDGSVNMLNATDNLLQLSDNPQKYVPSKSTYDRKVPSKNVQSLSCFNQRYFSRSPSAYDSSTNHGEAINRPLHSNSKAGGNDAQVRFHQSGVNTRFDNVKDVNDNSVHFQKQQQEYKTRSTYTKQYDQTKRDIRKPIPTKSTVLQSVSKHGQHTKQERCPVESNGSIQTYPVKDSDHHQRNSAFSTVKPQIMNGDDNTSISRSHLLVHTGEGRTHARTTLNNTSARSVPDIHFPTKSPEMTHNTRHSPTDVIFKLRGQSANTRTHVEKKVMPGLANTTGWNDNFRFTPQLLSDRVEIKTELLSKPKLIKTLQLPLENKSFHSGSDPKVMKIGQRLSSTESTTLIGELERPPADVTFHPHQLDIAVVQPDESIVVADGWNSCLIAFAKDGDHYYPSVMELSFDPCCLAEVDDNTVAVTGGTDIIFIKVKPDLLVEKTIYTQKYYEGIKHINPYKIAVSYTPNGIVERNVHIDILSFKGDLLQTIATEIDPDVYKTRLCCNWKGDLILACCSFGGSVAFLQKADNYACKFQINLTKPWSVAFDQHAHIYIVDGDMDHRRLVRTKPDGTRPEEILSAEHGSTIPASVVFGKDGFMYITQCDGNIKIFQITE